MAQPRNERRPGWGLKLPEMTVALDAGELAPVYAGVEVVLRVNPPYPNYRPPWADIEDKAEAAGMRAAEPWLSEFWYMRARLIKSVTIPGNLTEGGEPEVIAINYSARALYDLESDEGFDPRITAWATAQFGMHNDELFERAAKN
jgi:hypothetical protein